MEIIDVLENFGVPGVFLVLFVAGARAVWRFIVDDAWPEFISQRSDEKKNLEAWRLSMTESLATLTVTLVDMKHELASLKLSYHATSAPDNATSAPRDSS
jgi:hypothetical protein